MMLLRRLAVAVALATAFGSAPSMAAPAELCLTPDEITLSARMASVMSLGAALQRCGSCLGERYAEVVKHYEDDGLMKDFWTAQAKVKGQAKIDYIDDLVRQTARNKTADMSASCGACNATVDTLNGLTFDAARAQFYGSARDALSKVRIFKSCP